jgi:hypothetical protein
VADLVDAVRLRVGFGSGVITPDLPVVLAGFGARKGPATEVRHDLMAQAVVFRDGETTACLLVLDLLLLGADVAEPLRQAVATAIGISPRQVMPSCTHTHSGPAATARLKRIGWPMPKGYRQRLIEGCVTAAQTALETSRPATLSFGRAPLPAHLSLNRRGLPYDPSYRVLDVRGPDGTRIGSVAGVGIHPVALGITCREVSGDWITSYRERAERSTGAPAVLLQGALGDVNPTRDPHTDPDPGGNWETAQTLGSEVADCVGELLGKTEPLSSELTVHARKVPLRAGLTLPSLLNRVALRTIDVELLEWSLGGLRLVSVPGEAFHELGRQVEAARGDRAMIVGLSPEYHGYLPVPFGKGYEEKMSYGRRFVSTLTDTLVAGAAHLV